MPNEEKNNDWIYDLFGGREAPRGSEGNKRIGQSADDVEKSNQTSDYYPHSTRDHTGEWHRSEGKGKNYSHDPIYPKDAYEHNQPKDSDDSSSEEGNSWNLFGDSSYSSDSSSSDNEELDEYGCKKFVLWNPTSWM